jgi:hypothetical protein
LFNALRLFSFASLWYYVNIFFTPCLCVRDAARPRCRYVGLSVPLECCLAHNQELVRDTNTGRI